MPHMPAADAAGLVALLEGEGIAVWVDGGWAVDAVLGLQTRPHGDLDVALEERFVPVLRAALGARGFRDVPRDDTSPWNFVLGDGAGLEIDVHAFTFDDQGDGVYGPPENLDFYRAEALTGEGTIAGRRVHCISPAWLVRFRTGYSPRGVDRADVAALCGRFDIEVPAAYRAVPAQDSDRRGPGGVDRRGTVRREGGRRPSAGGAARPGAGEGSTHGSAGDEGALEPPITFDDFLRVELRVGRIVRAEHFAEARKPAYVLEVDFGEAIGVRRSSAQITDLYAPEELVGKLVVGVVNLAPKRIGPVVSECLVTGFHDERSRVVLCVPETPVPLGTKLL